MDVRPFRHADQPAVIELWEACGLVRPWNDPVRDIARKQAVQAELFLVAEIEGEIVGSAMAGYDGHRGWVNYLATAPEHQHRGIATALMASVEDGLRELGCPKINIQIRADNAAAAAFYERIGFSPDAVISLGKRLEED
ncbi:MAG: GNAT family acetyltransferase [Acidimicrobiia bacterium]|nr:GNAT family acetyltransferase [Acidimicrobiia bacterium]NNL69287.1 GNAT family acetyltransferase [Acidimicrobiia bacterium]